MGRRRLRILEANRPAEHGQQTIVARLMHLKGPALLMHPTACEESQSPKIPTRTDTILEMMEPVRIPNNNLPLCNHRYEFSCVVTIPTYPQILEDPDRSLRRTVYDPICNRQSFTVTRKYMLLLIILHILQNKAKVRNIAKNLDFSR